MLSAAILCNGLEPDQDQQNVGLNRVDNLVVLRKEFFKKKFRDYKKAWY